jgi:hypothetical protein
MPDGSDGAADVWVQASLEQLVGVGHHAGGVSQR